MESVFKLPVVNNDLIRLLQITDTHLFSGTHQTLLGVNTWRSYQAVLDAIVARQQPLDLVVATGDLVQDHSQVAYQHFSRGVTRLPAPMKDVLTRAAILPEKHLLLGDNWQIILLDSQVTGVDYGELAHTQLTWMEHCLRIQPQRHTLVLLHHHPKPSGCQWLDKHGLRNAQRLAAGLAAHTRVRTLLCGHIHQELDDDWYGLRLLACPSTCIQFKPRCTHFTLDTAAPGWRYLDLLPTGVINTQVHRLRSDEFCPAMSVRGY